MPGNKWEGTPFLCVSALMLAVGCGGYAETSSERSAQNLAHCGNGELDLGEGCDDGNRAEGDGCSAACQIEPGYFCDGAPSACFDSCGNGVTDNGEDCDGSELGGATCASADARFSAGQLGCTPQCRFNLIACTSLDCGDSNVDNGEECDDGNDDSTDACVNCFIARCGDGVLATTEDCDDGNNVGGDGCDRNCAVEQCGDDKLDEGEECEVDDEQGCTTSCKTSGHRSCSPTECAWSECIPPQEVCNYADDDCDAKVDTSACLSYLRRFYSASKQDHMYKVDSSVPDPGYVAEGYFYVYATPIPGTRAFYQVYNGKDHMLTFDPNEGAQFGYGNALLMGYVFQTEPQRVAGKRAQQLCRYYSSSTGDHLMQVPGVDIGYIQESCSSWAWVD